MSLQRPRDTQLPGHSHRRCWLRGSHRPRCLTFGQLSDSCFNACKWHEVPTVSDTGNFFNRTCVRASRTPAPGLASAGLHDDAFSGRPQIPVSEREASTQMYIKRSRAKAGSRKASQNNRGHQTRKGQRWESKVTQRDWERRCDRQAHGQPREWHSS